MSIDTLWMSETKSRVFLSSEIIYSFVTDWNFFDGNIVIAVCHRQTGTALNECFRWEGAVELERDVLRYVTYFHYLNNIDLFTSIGLKEERQDTFAVISRNLFAYGWSMIMYSYSLTLTWHGSICSSLSVLTLISHRYFIWELIHHPRKSLSLSRIHARLK